MLVRRQSCHTDLAGPDGRLRHGAPGRRSLDRLPIGWWLRAKTAPSAGKYRVRCRTWRFSPSPNIHPQSLEIPSTTRHALQWRIFARSNYELTIERCYDKTVQEECENWSGRLNVLIIARPVNSPCRVLSELRHDRGAPVARPGLLSLRAIGYVGVPASPIALRRNAKPTIPPISQPRINNV